MKSADIMIIAFLFIIANLSIMIIFGGIDFAPNFGLGGTLGWNWVGITCMVSMLIFSTLRSGDHAISEYITIRKKNIPLLICASIFPLLFYIALLDLVPRMLSILVVFPIKGINPIPTLLSYTLWGTIVNPLPSNFIGLAIYSGFTFAFCGSRLYLKNILPVFFVTVITNAIPLFAFNEINWRLVPEPQSTALYYLIYVPAWIIWMYGYTLMWKPSVIVTELEETI
jgi:hypothetical protein